VKFLIFSDQHLRSSSDRPKWRLDEHYRTQFEELEEVSSIANVNKVDAILGLGDFIHHPDVSHGLISDIITWAKRLPCPFFTIVGNHCCFAYRTDDLRTSGLGVLFESGVIKRLDELIFEDQKIVIRGIHANLDPRKGDYVFDSKYDNYFKIVATHNYITKVPQIFDHWLTSDVRTNASIVLSGHLHQGFADVQNGVRFVNPGSLSRWAINEQHHPQVLILDTATNVIEPVKLKCSLPASEIFDLAAAAELKTTEMNLEAFVASLENASFDTVDIENVVCTEGSKQGLSKGIVDMALAKIQQAKVELK
jgi:predicted phosphodiesterase